MRSAPCPCPCDNICIAITIYIATSDKNTTGELRSVCKEVANFRIVNAAINFNIGSTARARCDNNIFDAIRIDIATCNTNPATKRSVKCKKADLRIGDLVVNINLRPTPCICSYDDKIIGSPNRLNKAGSRSGIKEGVGKIGSTQVLGSDIPPTPRQTTSLKRCHPVDQRNLTTNSNTIIEENHIPDGDSISRIDRFNRGGKSEGREPAGRILGRNNLGRSGMSGKNRL